MHYTAWSHGMWNEFRVWTYQHGKTLHQRGRQYPAHVVLELHLQGMTDVVHQHWYTADACTVDLCHFSDWQTSAGSATSLRPLPHLHPAFHINCTQQLSTTSAYNIHWTITKGITSQQVDPIDFHIVA